MPPLAKQGSEKNEADVTLLSYNDALNHLNLRAKQDLDGLNNQIVLANSNLARLRDKILSDTQEFDKWKRSETLKFTNELSVRQNDIINKQNLIDSNVQQQTLITQDLQVRQQHFENLNKDRIQLREDQLEVQQMRIQAKDLINQAEIQKAEAIAQMNQANMRFEDVKIGSEKNKEENIRLVNLNASLEARAVYIEQELKNLDNLKEFVEPKLRLIKENQESLDNSKKDNDAKIAELTNKIQEEKILLQSLKDRETEIENKNRELLQKEEEFYREQALSKTK